MTKHDYSSFDEGEVVNYDIIPAIAKVEHNHIEEFPLEEMYVGADGIDRYASFQTLPSWDEEYSNLFGIGKSKEERAEAKADRKARRDDRREKRQERRDEKRERRYEKQDERQYRRTTRAEGKAARDTAQLKIAESAGQSDVAIADALKSLGGGAAAGAGAMGKSGGMSTGAKIGIAVAVLAVVGVGIYFVTKKK